MVLEVGSVDCGDALVREEGIACVSGHTEPSIVTLNSVVDRRLRMSPLVGCAPQVRAEPLHRITIEATPSVRNRSTT